MPTRPPYGYVLIEITLKSGERVSWQIPAEVRESYLDRLEHMIVATTGPIGRTPGIFAFPPARGFVVASEIAAVGVQESAELSPELREKELREKELRDKELLAADPRFRGIP